MYDALSEKKCEEYHSQRTMGGICCTCATSHTLLRAPPFRHSAALDKQAPSAVGGDILVSLDAGLSVEPSEPSY